MPNLWVVFLTGLTTGGLSCLAVQGGLLANVIASRADEEKINETEAAEPVHMTKQQLINHLEQQTKPKGKLSFNGSAAGSIGLFLAAKISAYTLLGFLLGWLGTTLQLTPIFRGVLMISIAVFMIGTALRMLKVHPFFDIFVIQPPRVVTRFIRRLSKKEGETKATSTFLGVLTVLIPCGVTQVMMAVALGTGSPIKGALIMLAFTLGTTPIFFILGYFAAKLGESLNANFMRLAGALILILALFSLESGLNLVGSPISYARIRERWREPVAEVATVPTQAPTTESTTPTPVDLSSPTKLSLAVSDANGYSPSVQYATADKPVDLSLQVADARSCVRAFTIPSLGIQEILSASSSKILHIPAQPKGTLRFSCSMGMYTGKIVFQ